MKILKNNKKIIIGLAILISSFIIKKIITSEYILLACNPSPYCNYSIYYDFPNLTIVLFKLLPWLIITGEVLLLWALGEKITSYIKSKKK